MPQRTALRLLALLLVLVPLSARAAPRPLESGAQLPPTSIAWEQSPFSLALNPAGLALGPSGVGYLFEHGETTLPNVRRTDALFASFGGSVLGSGASSGFGLSGEWVRPVGGSCSVVAPCLRRTTLGWAMGSPSFALGLAYHWFQSDERADVDALGTLDAGVIARPARWLSLAVLGSSITRDKLAGTGVRNRGTFALSLRPIDRILLATDWTVVEKAGWQASRFTHTISLGLLEGLELRAQAVHPLRDATKSNLELQVALRGGFGSSAVEVSGLGTGSNAGYGTIITAEASSARGPSLFGSPKTAQFLDISNALEGPSPIAQLLGRGGGLDPYTRLVLRLQRLQHDDSVGALVIEVRSLGDLSLGRIEELRTQLQALRASGRKVVAWLAGGGDAEYYFATAADRIYAAPQGMLLINGLSSERIYLRGLLDKVGVVPEFVKVGAYKSAPEQFTNTEASPASAEESNALLDDEFARYVAAIARARGITEEKVRGLLDEGIFLSERAAEVGLIDGVNAGGKALEEPTEKLAGRSLPRASFGPDDLAPTKWGGSNGLAIVEVSGAISMEGGGPAGGGASAREIVKKLRQAGEDASVSAVILRVESPGGDVTASELIYQAVQEVRKTKPVVASMGDVAASGGYYVAAGCDAIVAEPSTITGSIGVFAGKADLSKLLAAVGVSTQVFRRGERADLFTIARPWTEAERKGVQGLVDAFYETFLQRVAVGRKMARDDVHAVAQGRVWTGAQARSKGLVDELGGLETALRLARAKAGLPADAPVRVLGSTGLFDLPDVPKGPQAGQFGGPVAILKALLGGASDAEAAKAAAGAIGDAAWLVADALVEGRPLALAVDLPRLR